MIDFHQALALPTRELVDECVDRLEKGGSAIAADSCGAMLAELSERALKAKELLDNGNHHSAWDKALAVFRKA